MISTTTVADVYPLISPTVTDKIANMVLLEPTQLDTQKPLIEYGFDSIKAAELLAFIEETFSIEVEPQDIPDLITTENVLQHVSQLLINKK